MTYAFSSLKKKNINTYLFDLLFLFNHYLVGQMQTLSVRVVKLLKHGRLITELGSLYLHVIKLHTLAGRRIGFFDRKQKIYN